MPGMGAQLNLLLAPILPVPTPRFLCFIGQRLGSGRQTWIPLSGQSSGSYSTLTPKDVFTNTKRRNNLTSHTEG
jgi:hypothetical protein